MNLLKCAPHLFTSSRRWPRFASNVRSGMWKCGFTAICFITALLANGQADKTPVQENIASLHDAFAHPPDNTRIMVRWWWFGPSQTKEEIRRELQQMKSAGIGGVEIATLYPLSLDNPQTGFHNYPFLSDEHLQTLRTAADEAQRIGMRVDITLGSGWPLGGPHISVTHAAGELRVETISVGSGENSVPIPALESGEKLIAAYAVPKHPANGLGGAERIPILVGARVALPKHIFANDEVMFFISSRTGMMVKRPAIGASGFVLDHYDRSAIEEHLKAVGDRLLSAFRDHPPYAVFSDSLEDYGSDWTPDLLEEFRRRRGYDLVDHLPALVGDSGAESAAIRHDWGETLTELANERFLEPMQEWAHQHHTLLRSQTYGYPPVSLSSNRYEDLPEGEGKATIRMAREFSDTRWAASAGHLFGHNVISSETWTWLHSPAFRATPLDMKAEADLHFLQGINQLVGHGWPYSPESAGEPGWRMYAAGAFNAHNPWFPIMPDLAGYLQRVSFALRLGKPVNDAALLLPNDDAWASFRARVQKNVSATSVGGFDETGSNVSLDESLPKFLGPDIIGQVLDAGFGLDFIDADAINTVGIPYKVLILPAVDRIPLETYQKIRNFARRGGIVIATRRTPASSPGFLHANELSLRIRAISQTLFHGQIATAHFIADEHALSTQLAQWTEPDVTLTQRNSAIGFVHRQLNDGDLYFLANTSNKTLSVEAKFRSRGTHAELWDAFTGEITSLPDHQLLHLDLEAYGSRLIFLTNQTLVEPPPKTAVVYRRVDISHDWAISFQDGKPILLSELRSWTHLPNAEFSSGLATYRKSFNFKPELGDTVILDFGKGSPIPLPDPLPHFNMRAYLQSPVCAAGMVYVNNEFAGYVWHPPFQVNISKWLKSGENELRVVVGNTAINELAGSAQPDYRLLRALYGVEFIPQDMDDLKPEPSGMLGPITLIESRATR
jgi:hypothetical protein